MFCTEEELIARCSFSNRFDTYLVLKPQTKEKKKKKKQNKTQSFCTAVRQILFSQVHPDSNKSY